MKNLKRIRHDAGMSQSQLAQASGVALRMIQAYEQGTKDINRAEGLSIYHLAQALSCTVEDLLELDAAEPPMTITQALLLFSQHVPWAAAQCLEIVRHIELGAKDIYTTKGVQYLSKHLHADPECPQTVQAQIDKAIDQWEKDHPKEAKSITRAPSIDDVP